MHEYMHACMRVCVCVCVCVCVLVCVFPLLLSEERYSHSIYDIILDNVNIIEYYYIDILFYIII